MSDPNDDAIVVNWTDGFETEDTDESTWSGDADDNGRSWETWEDEG